MGQPDERPNVSHPPGPGWHPDPADGGRWRWWDGQGWTEDTSDTDAAGYQDGQLVLVSDGESNCGDPPCEVAQSIHDDGFDVTVNTLGFQISQEGREELTCPGRRRACGGNRHRQLPGRSAVAAGRRRGRPAGQRELHHPTAEGYRAMTHALVPASQTTRDEPPAQPAADGEVAGDQAVLPIDSGRTVDVDLRGHASSATTDLRRGDRVDLTADGFAAGAEVGVRLRSTPIALAAVIADDDGVVDTTVHVPASMPAGEHRLTLRGLDTELAEHQPEQAIRVRPERPRWLTATTVGATLAALITLGGLVAIVRTRPRQGTPHD